MGNYGEKICNDKSPRSILSLRKTYKKEYLPKITDIQRIRVDIFFILCVPRFTLFI